MVFDGELRESCARNLRVALSGEATACFLSGISGWFSLSLNPLARGGRSIWRGEVCKEVCKYGFDGAGVDLGFALVLDFVLWFSGSRRRPRRAQLRGQLRHDPIATAG